MLHGSQTRWCLKKNEMAILRRTRKVRVRVMCGVKMIDKRSQELYEFAGFKEYFGWTSQGKWSMMVRACFEKG